MLGVDIDNFKAVNDSLGHQVGDLVLKEVAEILKGLIRSYDLAARAGGDEFVVVLPGADREEALRTADRIRTEVDRYSCRSLRAVPGGIGASVGVACFLDDASDSDGTPHKGRPSHVLEQALPQAPPSSVGKGVRS